MFMSWDDTISQIQSTSTTVFFCYDNQRGALQAKVSDAIFRNYYMHA
jgi:hypothetical protein